MSDSTTNLDTISASQGGKEVTANALFDAGSPATLFGRRAAGSSGLTWAVYGGKVRNGAVQTTLANASVTLTANATNFVEFDPANVATNSGVSTNTTGFTAGREPLYEVVTNSGGTVTSYVDRRTWGAPALDRATIAVGGGANVTLTALQCLAEIIELTGALTANIAVIVPNSWSLKVIRNLTSGAFTVTVRTSAGTGPTIAQARSALVYANGTDVIRVTPDQATP